MWTYKMGKYPCYYLDYRALYKTPLILNHSLSANCSGIPMFDVWGRVTRVLKQKSNVKNVHIALRAVRFTRGLNPHKIMHKFESCAVYKSTQTSPRKNELPSCLRAARFTRIFKQKRYTFRRCASLKTVRVRRAPKLQGCCISI